MGIQGAKPLAWQKSALGFKARDLPEGMHSGIRASCPDNREPRLGDCRKRIFDRGLDGRRVQLALPA